MKRFHSFSFTALSIAAILNLTACSLSETEQVTTYSLPKKVTWLDSTGGSQPDTLLIKYPTRHWSTPASAIDCTYSAITVMLLSDSTGGSQPDTAIINNVVLRLKK